ncbi:MAG: D-glycero-alpha-D-manno-heptose-1,7-bisphosphate 7-phosphatase [Vulcanimicrobiota bacterium]
MPAKRFIILDRDGTIIEERHYLSDPADVALLPGAAEGLRRMTEYGMGLVLISNQSGIGRGFFTEAELNGVHQRLEQLLEEAGIRLDAIYFCPHTPEDQCRCRKPDTGLLIRAAEDLGLIPEECVVIGDKSCDIELGKRAGAFTILVRTGYGAATEREGAAKADYTADSLLDAADWIVRLSASGGHSENRL